MRQKQKYDVIIVGAGPAGLFAVNEIAINSKLSVLVIDLGGDVGQRKCLLNITGKCAQCVPCNIMGGVGGSGTFSDGTLNLRPDVGGDLSEFTKNQEEAWELVDYVDKIYLKYGAPDIESNPSLADIDELKRKSASHGARFIDIRQRHIGSDKAPAVISNFKNDLDNKGIHFLLRTKVTDLLIENGVVKGVIIQDGDIINSNFVLIATGRISGEWINELTDKHKIRAKNNSVDIGVRVEVPGIIMDPVTNINRDPKFHIYTKRYDDFVRTFCTNARGFVVKEQYEGFVAVNGHSLRETKSDNTNFAFLVQIKLTHPIENTTKYARSIANLAMTIGGGKPIIQKIGDLRKGRRSTEDRIKRNLVINTLKEVTPGDISMALPHRIVMNIIEGLEVLDKIIPGVASDSTLLYAPEIKFYATQIQVDNMETNISNLFAAGDGAGLSRDIINASATGVLAARGILINFKKGLQKS